MCANAALSHIRRVYSSIVALESIEVGGLRIELCNNFCCLNARDSYVSESNFVWESDGNYSYQDSRHITEAQEHENVEGHRTIMAEMHGSCVVYGSHPVSKH